MKPAKKSEIAKERPDITEQIHLQNQALEKIRKGLKPDKDKKDNSGALKKRHAKVLIAVLLFLGFCISLNAATKTWTNGNSTGIWSDGANWSPSGVPGSTDDVVFNSTSTANSGIDASYSIHSFAIAGTYTGVVSLSSNTLTVSSGFSAAGTALFNPGSGKLLITGSQTINTLAPLYDLEISAGSGGQIFLANNVKVNNNFTLTSTQYLYGGFKINVSKDVTINSAWLQSGSSTGTISFVGSTDQTLTGTGTMSYIDISKSSGNVLIPATINLGNGGVLTGAVAGLMSNTGGIVNVIGSYTFAYSGSIDDMEINAPGQSIALSSNVNVNNNFKLTSVATLYGNFGNTQIKVKKDVSINSSWAKLSGSQLTIISLVGSTDQTLTGTGLMSYIDVSKTGGNVLLPTTISLGNGGILSGTTTGLLSNTGGIVKVTDNYTFNYSGSIDDLEINAPGKTVQIFNNVIVNNNFTLTSVASMYNPQGNGIFKVKKDVTLNSSWALATGSQYATISLIGSTDQTLTGTGTMSFIDISKTGGNVLIPTTINLGNGGVLTGTSTGLMSNTGGIVNVNGSYSFNYLGTIDDMEINAPNQSIALSSNVNVNNNFKLTSISFLYGNFGSTFIKVKKDVTINSSWSKASGSQLTIISLIGSTDQTLTGTGLMSYIDVSKTGGNVLLPTTINLGNGGILSGNATALMSNTGGIVKVTDNYTFNYSGSIDDLEINAPGKTVQIFNNVIVNNNFTLTSVTNMYNPQGNGIFKVKKDVTINSSWALATGSQYATISLVGSTDQTLTGTGTMSFIDISKTGGNVLLPTTINLGNGGTLSGTATALLSNTGGIVKVTDNYTFSFSGSIDDLEINATGKTVQIYNIVNVNNNFTLTSVTYMYNPQGNGTFKVKKDVTINSSWAQLSGNQYATISFVGSIDQTLTGTGIMSFIDISKSGGNVLLPTTINLGNSGTLTGTAIGLLSNTGGIVKVIGTYTFNYSGSIDDLEINAPGKTVQIFNNVIVNNNFTLTSVTNMYNPQGNGIFKVKKDVTINSSWALATGSQYATISLIGSTDQTLTGTGTMSFIDISKTGGNVLIPTTINLGNGGVLTGTSTGLVSNTGGIVKVIGSYTFSYSGSIDDMEINAPNQSIALSSNVNVNNNFKLTSISFLYGNFGSTFIKVKKDVTINSSWSKASGSQLTIISLIGSTDQTLTGTGLMSYIDVSKTGGNVLLPTTINLGNGGILSGNATALMSNTGGIVKVTDNYTFNYSGSIDDLEINAPGKTVQIFNNVIVNNNFTLTSVTNMYNPQGNGIFKVKKDVTINSSWALATGSQYATISLVGSTDQTLTGTGTMSFIDISKTGGNVLLPTTINLGNGGTLSGTATALLSNTGGIVKVTDNYTFSFSGSIDDLEINATGKTVQIYNIVNVNNNFTLTSVTYMYNPQGNGTFKVKKDVTINSSWAQLSGNQYATISFVGSIDQTLTGTGIMSFIDISKSGGNVLLPTTINLGNSGTLTGTAIGLLSNTGGIVKVIGTYTFNYSGSIDDLEINAPGKTVQIFNNVIVNNNFTLTSVTSMYNPQGNGIFKVKKDVTINSSWALATGSQYATISLIGSTDQTLTGTGTMSFIDISKTGGNVLIPTTINLGNGGVLTGTATGLMSNTGGIVNVNGSYSFNYLGTIDDMEINAPNQSIALSSNVNVNNNFKLTSISFLYGNFGSTFIKVKKDVTINSSWSKASGSQLTIISLIGSTDQTLTGTGLMSYIDVSKTGGNVLLPTTINLGNGGILSGNATALMSNTGGIVKVTDNYTFNYPGSIDDLEINAPGKTIQIFNNVIVNNNFTLTSVASMYNPQGNGIFKVKKDVTINSSWALATGSQYATISLIGSTDQTLTGSGAISFIDITKTGGNVLIPSDITLGNFGTITGTSSGHLLNTGGKVKVITSYTFNFPGIIDDLEINAPGQSIALSNTVNVNNNFTLTSLASMYGNFGNTFIKVKKDIAINSTWAQASGSQYSTISLNGSTDQTISGSAQGTYLDFAKSAGNVFITNTHLSFTTISVSSGIWNMTGNTISSTNTISASGTIAGTGTLNANVTVNNGGGISPGGSNNPGCITINGNLVMGGGSTYTIDIDNGSACTNYDQLNVNGTVTLFSPTLAVSSASASYNAAVTIINNDNTDNVSGVFSNAANNTNVSINGGNYKVKYNSSNNDVIIQPADFKPTAICQNVTVSADANCSATVSASQVDNGSTDPEGSVTLSISPAGPFAVGTTNVTLTVTDNIGQKSTCSSTITVLSPEINLKGNSVSIVDGDATPSASDSTDFGSVTMGSFSTKTYSIENTGNGNLDISGISFSGTNAAQFSLVGSAPTQVSANGSVAIVVKFTPSASGAASATIHIANNDCNEGDYDFAMGGTGLVPAGALNFDGADDYIDVPYKAAFKTTTLTMEAWVYPQSTGVYQTICGNEPASSANGYGYGFRQRTNNEFGIVIGGAGYGSLVLSTTVLSPGNWYHLAGTYDGKTIKFYVNGNLEGTASYSQSITSTTDFYIGKQPTGSPFYLKGNLDEIRVWNRVLCQAEIQASMNCGLGLNQSGLVAYYKFNEGNVNSSNSGVSSLYDSSGNGYDGKLFNFSYTGTASNWVSGHVSGTCAAFANPVASLSGNSNSISNGATTTSAGNNTDFGQTNGTAITETFTISNSGNADLTVSSIVLGGTNPSFFTVGGISLPATIAANGSTTFTVTFSSTLTGVKTATVTVNSNDCNNPAYAFAIKGELTCLAPVFTTCPGNITTGTTINSCDAVVSYISATTGTPSPALTYTFSGATTGSGSGNGSGSTFSKGVTNVSITATNSCGSATCSFTVTVSDVTPPTVVTKNITVNLASDGTATIQPSDVDNGSVDNCSAVTLSLDNNSFGCSNVGTPVTVTLTASDASGNHASGTATVTVKDVTAPTVITKDISVNVDANNSASITASDIDNGSTDNCSLILSIDKSSFDCSNAGVNTVTLTAKDPSGNIGTKTATVTVNIPVIGVSGNTNAIVNGSSSTSASNNTDFGSSGINVPVSQTFTISNSGDNTLTIGSVTLTGTNASDFSVTTQPASSVSTGNSTTFTVQFNPSAAGSETTTINFSDNACADNSFSFSVSGTGLTPAGVLSFDGSNDYISVPNSTAFNTSTYTAEAWVYLTNASNSGFRCIMSRRTSGTGWNLYKSGSGTWSLWNGWSEVIAGPSVSYNTWTHIAATGDSHGQKLYINGTLVGSTTAVVNPATGQNFTMGAVSDQTTYFLGGSLEEVRFWNRALCQSEIQSTMNCELSASQNGLVAYYQCNQGFINGNNASVNTLTDNSGNSHTGSLNNFGLSGTSSNWAAGKVSGTCNAFTNPISGLTGNNQVISNGSASTSASNNTDFGSTGTGVAVSKTFTITNSGTTNLNIGAISFSGSNASDFSVSVAPAASVAVSGSTSFTVSFSPSSSTTEHATISIANDDCYNNPYTFALSGTGLPPAGALDLNGSSDYVDIGSAIPSGSSYTKECWVNAQSTSCDNMISSNTDPFWFTGGHLSAGQNNTYSVLTDPATFTANTWTHVAVTYDAPTHTMKLYKNGVLVGSTSSSPAYNGGPIALGHHYNGGCYFQGQLDEVRLWSRALCQSELQNNMNCELSGTQTGLIAYYKMNQGFVNATNTSVNTVTDNSGNGHTGTMSGFALTGTSSNWIAGHISGSCTSFTNATASVSGNNTAINNGSSIAITSNNTDFGKTTGASITETFTVTNTGSANLLIASISITGSNPGNFVLSGITLPASVSPASTTTLSVTFNPTSIGVDNALITLNTNDCNNPTYSFAIKAELTCTTPAFTSCPANITTSTSGTSCDAVVTYGSAVTGTPAPTISYAFTGVTTGSGSGNGSGSVFTKGVTNVTITATNTCGTATCSFTVTVKDDVAPVVHTKDITLYLDQAGKASITAADIDNGSTDNCHINSLGISNTQFGCNNATYALDFDGSNDYVQMPNGIVSGLSDFTYEAWVNYTNNGAWTRFFDIGINTTYYMFFTANANRTPNSGNPRFAISTGGIGGEQLVTSSIAMPTGWHHVAITLKKNTSTGYVTGTLYIDGNIVGQNTSMTLTPNAIGATIHNYLGKSQYADPYLKATMDEVRIWSIARTQAEIQANMGNALSGNEYGLFLYYNFEDGPGNSTTTDRSQSHNNGMLVNMNTATAYVNSGVVQSMGTGQNIVGLTVTDESGNNSTGYATVTVLDTVHPKLSPKNITLALNAAGTASIKATDVLNSYSDNCGVATLTLSKSTFSCSDLGANTISITATDVNGNVRSSQATVTVVDNISPTVITKNITVYLDATNGTVSIQPTDVDNGTYDNCHFSLSVSPNTFDCSNTGANTVTLTATDASNNVSSHTATVTVIDQTAPTVITKNITVYLDASTGTASITPVDVDNGTYDNCHFTLAVSPNTFDCSNTGSKTVTLIATDASNNVSTQTATVTIVDQTAPTVITKNITVYLDATSGMASITPVDVDNGSYDNCHFTLAVSPNTFDCSNTGSNTVTLTATDASNNVSTQTATVTIVDQTAPTVISKNITVYLDAANGTASIIPADVDNGTYDNCHFSLSVSPNNFDCSNAGANTVTLTATDASNNVSTQIATVTVVDQTAPTVITKNITVYLNATNGTASIAAADVDNGTYDNCHFTLGVSPNTFDCSNTGSNTVTLTATDASNNVSTQTATVTIVDQTAPTVITKNINAYLDATGNVSISPADVDGGTYDNCHFTMSLDKSSFSCSNEGANMVTLTATDASSNASTSSATVTVIDNIAPTVITKNVLITLNQYNKASISVSDINNGSYDNCTIVSMTLDKTNFDCSNVNANTVILTVTDNSGNISTGTAIVTVKDAIAPKAKAKSITVYLDASGNVTVASTAVDNGSSDNCGIKSYTLSQSTFGCHDLGSNKVTLTVADAWGNTASATCYINVKDISAPSISVQNFNAYLDANGRVTVNASQLDNGTSDNCSYTLAFENDHDDRWHHRDNDHDRDHYCHKDDDDDYRYQADDDDEYKKYDCDDLGPHTVKVYAIDPSGNYNSATAVINVIDNTAPVVKSKDITVYLDKDGDVRISGQDVDMGSRDNCRIKTYNLSRTSFDCSNLGPNVLSYFVTDAAGNSSKTVSVIVTVKDNIAPKVDANDITAYLDANGRVMIHAKDVIKKVSDNCSIRSISLDDSTFDCTDLGKNTTVYLTATDPSGNIGKDEVHITVQDNIAPKVRLKDVTLYLDANGEASLDVYDLDNGSTDNCGVILSFVHEEGEGWEKNEHSQTGTATFDCGNIGNNTITVYGFDKSGNYSTGKCVVTIKDNISPVVKVKDITVTLDKKGQATIEAKDIDHGSSDNCKITSMSLDKSSFDCGDVGDNTITLTATDASGNTSSATATVTVQSTLKADAGDDATVYNGYSPNASTTLSGKGSGGSGKYTYKWSTNATTSSITVSPTTTTTYTLTVTDGNGCTASDDVEVTSVNVHCGSSGTDVKMCQNGNTICVKSSDVPAYLKKKAKLGSCDGSAMYNGLPDQYGITLDAYPNPFNEMTVISFTVPQKDQVKLELYNMKGELIKTIYTGEAFMNNLYTFDLKPGYMASGIYLVKLTTSNDVQYIKLMKRN